GGLVVAARTDDDEKRHGDERAEDGDIEHGIVLHRFSGHGNHVHERTCAFSSSSRISVATGSSLRFANDTYHMVITKVVTNCPSPKSSPTVISPQTRWLMNSVANAASRTYAKYQSRKKTARGNTNDRCIRFSPWNLSDSSTEI